MTKQTIIGIFSLAFVIVALTWGNYTYLSSSGKYANEDYMSYWVAGRAMQRGLDSYDADVWNPLREEYGSKWFPDPVAPHPLWATLLMFPLSLLSLSWSAAVWLTLSQIMICATVWLISQTYHVQLNMGQLALTVLGSFLFRGIIISLDNGQVLMLLTFIIALYLYLTEREQHVWAGFALSFLLFKPNTVLLFIPVVGIWLIWQKRWRTIQGGILGGMLQVGLSLLYQPTWMAQWIVSDRSARAFQTPTFWGISGSLWPEWWALLGAILCIGATAVLALYLFRNPNLSDGVVLSLAIVLSLLTTPYAWAYEHTMLLIPLLILFMHYQHTKWIGLLWLLLIFILPWAIYYQLTIPLQNDASSFLVPLLTGAIFIWLMNRQPKPQISPKL